MPEFSSVLDIPDVFFEVANENRRPATTLLYSLEPKGIGTGQCESMKSYIYRLADSHRISPAQLLNEILWDRVKKRLHLKYPKNRRGIWNNSWLLSTGTRTDNLVEVLANTTGISALMACTMQPIKNILNTRTLVSMADRYCPECINQHGNAYDAYGRLLWLVGSINACPIHGIRLVQQTCGAESGKRLELFRGKWLPGACMSCGSIAFQCSAQARQNATEVEIWNATQVADLISYFPGTPQLFSRESLASGLSGLIAEYRKGMFCVAARSTRIHKSVVWGWIRGHHLPSLDKLLDLCLAAQMSLTSVLMGAPISCPCPNSDEKPPRPANRKLPKSEREAKLKEEILTFPPRSLASVAAEMGISRKCLQIQFPDLVAKIIERFGQFHRGQSAQKQQKAQALAGKLVKELRAKKMPLTLRNLREASGKFLLPHSRLREALKPILCRDGLVI